MGSPLSVVPGAQLDASIGDFCALPAAHAVV